MAQVLVTGASGFVGSHLIPALVHAGHEVICCGRSPESLQRRFPTCRVVQSDMALLPAPAFWDSALRGVSVVINAAGIIQQHGTNTFEAVHRDGPSMMFCAAERAGVQRIIQISALGADMHAATQYHRMKWAADEVLRGLRLEWVILQPSIIYGPGGRSLAFFSALAALPLMPLIGRGDQQIQPVHVDDVVGGIVRLLHSNAPSCVTLSVVGPEPVTFREFLKAIRRWLGLAVAPEFSIPLPLMRLAARVGDLVRSDFVNTDTLRMLCRGNTADATPYVTATGVQPRTLSTGLSVGGAGHPEYLSASLYFLTPLLRLTLAAVWVGSGVVSLFFFPQETSEGWLRRVGIPSLWAAPTLVVASVLDIVLGLATLIRWHLPLVLSLQLLLVLGFTLILTAGMPELWVHPFGPLLKNLSLFVATLMLWALERRR